MVREYFNTLTLSEGLIDDPNHGTPLTRLLRRDTACPVFQHLQENFHTIEQLDIILIILEYRSLSVSTSYSNLSIALERIEDDSARATIVTCWTSGQYPLDQYNEEGEMPSHVAKRIGYTGSDDIFSNVDKHIHIMSELAMPLSSLGGKGQLLQKALLDAIVCQDEAALEKAIQDGASPFLECTNSCHCSREVFKYLNPLHLATVHYPSESIVIIILREVLQQMRKHDIPHWPLSVFLPCLERWKAPSFIHELIRHDKMEALNFYLQHFDKKNHAVTFTEGDHQPLMLASALCNVQAVDILLRHSADPHYRSPYNETALTMAGTAATSPHPPLLEIIERFLPYGKVPSDILELMEDLQKGEKVYTSANVKRFRKALEIGNELSSRILCSARLAEFDKPKSTSE